ncbi:MAG: trehalose-phosphatase [Bdellovibrionales bacterium]
MMYLFSKNAQVLLESLSYTNTLFAFDFDGTLSKIVRNPEGAVVAETLAKMIQELNAQVPVAIVSGRSRSDLKTKFSFRPKYLIGNHGLEGSKTIHKQEIFKKVSSAWRNQIQTKLFGKNKKFEGVEVEDKEFSLALHYRKSRSKRAVKKELLQLVQNLEPTPRIVLGKCVINLIPIGGPHKGMALLDVMSDANVKQAFYIGDDDTDEDVFSLNDSRIFTVRVGKKVNSSAKFFIKNQAEVHRLVMKILFYYRITRAKTNATNL